MRFEIKKMKYQGIFLAALTGVLTLIIVVSSITNTIKDATPPVEDIPADSNNSGEVEDNLNVETNDFGPSGNSGGSGGSSGGHTHNWVRGGTVEPTCEEEGYDLSTCSCKEEKKTNTKPALGHDWGEWSLVPAEEEGEEEYMVRVCQRCEKVEKKTEQAVTPPAGGEGETPDGEQCGEGGTTPDGGDSTNPDGTNPDGSNPDGGDTENGGGTEPDGGNGDGNGDGSGDGQSNQ